MYLSTGSLINIVNCQFNKGEAIFGGAIFVLGDADVTISNAQFTENHAEEGGAIHATSFKTLIIKD